LFSIQFSPLNASCALKILDRDLYLPKYLFTACADRRTQGGDGIGRVEVEHRLKIFMAEILAGIQPTA
jgi:hypothetical protein